MLRAWSIETYRPIERQAMKGKRPAREGAPMTIRHEGDKWVLYTRDGGRVLGRHGTKKEALAQERAIKAHGG